MSSDNRIRHFRTLRHIASVLLGACLVLAVGARGANAAEPPEAPTLVSVDATSTTTLSVSWADVGEDARGVLVLLYDSAGSAIKTQSLRFDSNSSDRDSADTGGMILERLEPDTRYCVGVKVWAGRDPGTDLSEESERQCVSTPAPAPKAPNLAVREIRGKEDVDFAVPGQRNPVYILMLQNDGGDANGSVVVEIQTSGVVTLTDQLPILQQGWEAQGFSCERTGASGGANASMLCTGGTLKEGQSFDPGVLTRVTGRGFGNVHVAINVTHGRGDSDPGDNHLTLGVQAT